MEIKTAIYVRQSQDKAEGIDRQLAKCRAKAEERGWTVVEEYKDNFVSATKQRGPATQWAAMLADFKRDEFTHVVGVDMSRLLRSARDMVMLLDIGLLVNTTTNDIDFTTSEGRYMAMQFASAAEFEMSKKSERQKNANAYRVSLGRPVPGRRRYGYDNDNMTVRKSEAKHVKWMFEQVGKGRSIRSIALNLKSDGIKTTSGRDWQPLRVREVITNPAYIGKLTHLGVVHEKSQINPVVSQELFDKVGAVLADPTRKKSPGGARKHLASGIAICGECGNPLTFRNGYLCLKSLSHPFIKKEFLEERISEEIFFWIVDHPELKTVDADDGDSPFVSSLISDLDTKQESRVRCIELFSDGIGDLALIKNKIVTLDSEIEKLKARILQARGVSARSELVEVVRGDWWARRHFKEYTEKEKEALEGWGPFWEALELDTKRNVVKATLNIKVISAGKGAGRLGPDERVLITWKESNATP